MTTIIIYFSLIFTSFQGLCTDDRYFLYWEHMNLILASGQVPVVTAVLRTAELFKLFQQCPMLL